MSTNYYWMAAIVGIIVCATLINVVSSWLKKPSFLRWWHIILILVVLVASSAVFTVVQNRHEPSTPIHSITTDTESTTVASILPGMVNQIVLSIDDSTGVVELFSSRLDGSNRQHLWDDNDGLPLALISQSSDLIVSRGQTNTLELDIVTLTGNLVRVLTHPAQNEIDNQPVVAQSTHEVYFIRSHYKAVDSSSGTLENPTVMRVSLDGNASPTTVPLPAEFMSVSVDDRGTIIAGSCAVPTQNNSTVCVVDLATKKVLYILDSSPNVSDVEISPNGRYAAYSSFAVNPYGNSEIYVYDLQQKSTVMLTNLDGDNDQMAWVRGSSMPCLLFHHSETSNSSIYLACLQATPVLALAIPIGQYPVWFGLPNK